MTPEAPDVSVVMSVYNEATTVGEAMESILGQHDVSLELVVVDDGSDDGSADVLRGFATRDPRVRVLRQDNQGLTKALIRACAEARGHYLARHDASDVSLSGRFASQYRALSTNERLTFVSCWTEFCGPSLEPLYVAHGSGEARLPGNIIDLTREFGALDGPTAHGSVMMRRDAYETAGGYRTEFRQGQDWDLWYRLAEIGHFQVLPHVLYRARVTPEGLTFTQSAVRRQLSKLPVEALRRRQARLSEDPVLAEARRLSSLPRARPGSDSYARGFYFIGECLRRRGDPRANVYLRRALAASPLFWPAWLRLFQGWVRKPSLADR